jgi:outer membrane biosynthesis protein TonB
MRAEGDRLLNFGRVVRGAKWMGLLGLALAGCATEKAEGRSGAPPSKASQPEAQTVTAEQNDAIDALFRRKAQELQSCWNDEYERSHDRRLEGDLTVGLTVTMSGRPNGVQILRSTMGSPSVEGCVVKTVTSWAFPEVSADTPYRRTVHLGAAF